MEVKIYRKLHFQVLKDIASENLCFLKFKYKDFTQEGKLFYCYEIKTIGLPHYIKDTFFTFLDWVKNESHKY